MIRSGGVVFEQPDVEAPANWSDTAVAMTASRYFAGRTDRQGRERSIRELVERVVGKLSRWSREGGYFADEASAEAWAENPRYLLLTVGQVAVVFVLAWRPGLKAIAVYRQGSKRLDVLRAAPAPPGRRQGGSPLSRADGTVGPAAPPPSPNHDSRADRPYRWGAGVGTCRPGIQAR